MMMSGFPTDKDKLKAEKKVESEEEPEEPEEQ